MAENVGIRGCVLNNLVRNNRHVSCGNERLILFNFKLVLEGAEDEHQNGGRQEFANLEDDKTTMGAARRA